VKVSGFRVNFVEVCEWFDGCDKLRIIFKLRKKTRSSNCPLFSKIVLHLGGLA